ncbi:uncharacterized protein P884DRAFT_282941 [Thermothelomyces heterothallicus CBS 202.75]|uniref:uncharacterized protein n=1 Tax=Thermothelomyces heterothallicus CBS 202.75 TaxID=1149848 RepID=UPI0037425B27
MKLDNGSEWSVSVPPKKVSGGSSSSLFTSRFPPTLPTETMASAAWPPTTSFYGPISPAILGSDWGEEEGDVIAAPAIESVDNGKGVEVQNVQNRQQPPGESQTQPQPQPQLLQQQQFRQQSKITTSSLRSLVLDFWGFNAALLDDFFDDGASEVSGMATDGGSVAGDEASTGDGNLEPYPTQLVRDSNVGSAAPATRNKRPETEERRSWSRRVARSRDTSANRSEPDRPTNPYTAAIEEKQNAMTVEFLRSSAGIRPGDASPIPTPDDLGFGQRYSIAAETSSVVISDQRRLPDILGGERECIVCTDTKPVSEFPTVGITKACNHEPATCLACVATSIRTDLNTRLWNEIKCPECRETLEYDDVQRFADEETKERYQTLSFRSAVSSSPNFLWCTAGCGYGQIHEGGESSPIVTCRLCSHRSCFHHKVAWHENLTCDEYDSLLADPVNFRSRFDAANEEAEKAAAARRAQEDADRAFAQALAAEERRALVRQRAEREEREKREKREHEMRELALRRKQDEEASLRTVGTTTKPCPGCRAPIEKNAGCAGALCKYEFCWDCLASHRRIMETDNSAHKEDCPWHPNNLKD